MADDRCEVRSGGCGEGESGEPTPEVSQGRIVGYDSNRVIDDSMNDHPFRSWRERRSLPPRKVIC